MVNSRKMTRFDPQWGAIRSDVFARATGLARVPGVAVGFMR
jgi:hypothetical protein